MIEEDDVETNAEYFPRIHSVLMSILKLIPTGPSFLLVFLTDNFPHKTESLSAHKNYISNILSIIEYCPELRDSLWMLIFERVIQIDV